MEGAHNHATDPVTHTMATLMTLEEATLLLPDDKDAKRRIFRESYESVGMSSGTDLREYLTAIGDDIDGWFGALPSDWESKKSLANAKRAVNKVLNNPEARAYYGERAATDLDKALNDRFTHKADDYCRSRGPVVVNIPAVADEAADLAEGGDIEVDYEVDEEDVVAEHADDDATQEDEDVVSIHGDDEDSTQDEDEDGMEETDGGGQDDIDAAYALALPKQEGSIMDMRTFASMMRLEIAFAQRQAKEAVRRLGALSRRMDAFVARAR